MAGSTPAVQRIYVGGWRSDITREDCGYINIYIMDLYVYIYTFLQMYVCRMYIQK